jgi:demethylmenaquinone methyltransferase/2-methoxy-6-polyprenyl-1,4-benzoquinol methylase
MAVNDRHVQNKAAFTFRRDKPQRLFYMFLIEPLLLKAKNSVTLRVLRLKPKQLLEVGCGTCLQSLKIAQAGVEVTGIDISNRMFPSSAKIPTELTVQVADGTNLPFPDDSFDLTLISLALHEMVSEKRLPIIKELIRTLRPGGAVLILDYDTGIQNSSDLTSWLIKAIEWLAGKEHHSNFRDFLRNGGVPGLLAMLGYRVSRRVPVLNGMAAIFEVTI